MRVVIGLLRYFPHGGLQRDCAAVANLLAARGHEVRLHCHTFDGPPLPGIELRVLPARGFSNHRRAANFASDFGAALRAAPADVVLGFDKVPGLDLYFAADPCFTARLRRQRPRWVQVLPRHRTFTALERAVLAPPSRTLLLLLSDAQRTEYEREYGPLGQRARLLPPGLAADRRPAAPDAAGRAATRSELGVRADEHLLLLLATNPHLKGLDRAIEAVATLPTEVRERCQLRAIGAPPDVRFERLARTHGIGAHCRMLPARDDVPQLLRAADLLLHPARADNTGTVLLEALVAGRPVVCTSVCGHAHHVRAADAGVVLPEPFEVAALTAALRDLLCADAAELQARAAAYGQRLDLGAMHRAVVDAVEQRAQRQSV